MRSGSGPSAKFLAPAKKRLVLGVLQTRFLTLSSSHFDPKLPWSDLLGLVDHLVSAKQNRSGHREAKRLGGLEVHGHLEFHRKLHREIARLCAAQNAVDIGGGATKDVYRVDSVA